MQVAIATFAGLPPEFTDDQRLAAELEQRGIATTHIPWDHAGTDWSEFDAVAIRSTWDYSKRREEFVVWCASVGERLHNSPAVVAWNSDKRYLGDFAAAGIGVVETEFAAPVDPLPVLEGEIVIKPTVSAGGRDSGRFSPVSHELARELIATIHATGRTAMVQPFHETVETVGETAVLCIDGEVAHVLRKSAVLQRDEVAPVRDDALGVAEIMYDPGLVTADRADEDELALAGEVIDYVAKRFGYLPLYARVDMIRDRDGSPILLELEAIEPNFYLEQSPGTAGLFADAVVNRLQD